MSNRLTLQDRFWLLVYNLIAVPILYGLIGCLRLVNKKIAAAVKGRQGWYKQLVKDLSGIPGRDSIYLFHASSAGEMMQALPVIRLMKKQHPSISIGLSLFSPSGYNFFKPMKEIDFLCYLPFDSYANAKRFFLLIKPKCFLVSKLDVWPNCLFRCEKESIPVFLIAATLAPTSKRILPGTRSFNKSVYKRFTAIFPISETDSDRFFQIYPFTKRLFTTGDTRFEEVEYRSRGALAKIDSLHFYHKKEEIVCVLGSIWESDAEVVIPAVISLIKIFPQLRVLIVPHEPKDRFLATMETSLSASGIKHNRYSRLKEKASLPPALFVDTIGMLAPLYSIGSFAFVGGSFHSSGIHNVMEPAIMGNPVLFGPRHHNSYEALQMEKIGCAFTINTSDDFVNICTRFMNEPDYRQEIGDKLQSFISRNLGASQRIVDKIEEMTGLKNDSPEFRNMPEQTL